MISRQMEFASGAVRTWVALWGQDMGGARASWGGARCL